MYPAAYSGYVARTATYQESVGGRLLVEMRARPPSADGSVERPPSTEPAAIDRAGHVLYELARRGPHGDLPHDEPLPDDAPLDSRPEIVSGGSDPTSASSGPIVRVDVRLLVGTDGAVDSAMALVGDSSLHAEAHAAAMKIRYAPMTMEGRPVRVSLTRFVGVDTSSTGGRSETDGPRAIPTADQGADSADDTVYDFDDLDQPIRPVRMVAPRYSDSDTVLTTDDWVWLDVVVGPDGRVETARVVQGFPVLHEGAIAAALKTVYSSPTVGGRPVRVRDRLGLMSPALPPEATAPEKMFHPAYFSWLEGGGYEWTANRRLPHEPVFDVVGAAIDRVILAEPRRADVLEMMRNVPRPRWLAVHVRWLYGDDGLPLRVEAEVGRGALEEVDGRKWTDRHRRMRTDVGTPSVVAATRFAVRGALAELSNSLDVPLSGSARLMVGYRPETFR